MLKSADLNQELKTLDEKVKKNEVSNGDVVKAITLLIKVARDIRTNQVTALVKQYGRDILKTKRPDTSEKPKTD